MRRLIGQSPDAESMWAGMARSGGAKLAVLPISAVLGLVNTRLIIENYGTGSYAQYGLLIGMGALLPFTDLGISAAVMNAIAATRSPGSDPGFERILVSALRILVSSALVIITISLAITVLGAWPTLLGDGLMPGAASLGAGLCLALIGVGVPVGIGQRILSGLGRNHLTILVMGLQTPLMLMAVLTVVALDLGAGPYLATLGYAVTLLLAGVCLVIGARAVRPALAAAWRNAMRVRSYRGGRVFDVAWPMLVQMIALPIAMQSNRIVLSHIGGQDPLAEYNLASQMYTPIWGLVSAAGFTLWPVFARARAEGRSESPLPISRVFGLLAAVACLAVSLAAPWLAQVASGGAVTISTLVILSFSALMILQAIKYPLGMHMTDAAGLRYQAFMILLMLPVNIGLSIYLAVVLGAAGPVLGSVLGVLFFQVIANAVYVRRQIRSQGLAVGLANVDR